MAAWPRARTPSRARTSTPSRRPSNSEARLKRKHMRTRIALLVVAAPILVLAPRAQAAAFNVKPTQINLSAKVKSSMLGIRNESAETLRFQLSVFTWAQSAKGEMELAPTTDIVFFPALL